MEQTGELRPAVRKRDFDMTKIGIVLGSTRPNRDGEQAAR